MVDVGICQKNACDRSVARRVAAGLQLRHAFDLPGQIGRCVDQEIASNGFRVAADRGTRLRLRRNFPRPSSHAVRTGTVPLRQTATGRAAEDMYANQPEFRSN